VNTSSASTSAKLASAARSHRLLAARAALASTVAVAISGAVVLLLTACRNYSPPRASGTTTASIEGASIASSRAFAKFG
jgi:hypothetical protein